jgi:hypothetical protein
MVRTTGFQSVNRGSIPREVTKLYFLEKLKAGLKRIYFCDNKNLSKGGGVDENFMYIKFIGDQFPVKSQTT